MTDVFFDTWDRKSPATTIRSESDSFESRHYNEQILSRFYMFKAQALLAIERRDVTQLTAVVSAIAGFLAGVQLDKPPVALDFLRKKKHTIQSLVRELNILEDSFMAFRKK